MNKKNTQELGYSFLGKLCLDRAEIIALTRIHKYDQGFENSDKITYAVEVGYVRRKLAIYL